MMIFELNFITVRKGHIESGKINPSKKQTSGWHLHHGDGQRNYTERVNFSQSFDSTPNIFLGFSTQDVLTDADHR